MTDFDPDAVYHITYDGWPIQRQVDKDGQTNPIGFNSEKEAVRAREALRGELVAEYLDDSEHTQGSAQAIAERRIQLVRQDL